MPEQPADWLRLLRTPGIGTHCFQAILTAFGSPLAFLDADAASIHAAGLDPALREAVPETADEGVEADLAWLADDHHHLLTRDDSRFPESLLAIASPPPLLFVTGDPALLQHTQIAMVGSRKASHGGADNAYEFARHLAGCGLAITSGLALGIDAAAHRGALAAGGRTIAVTATGPDRVYPARHRDLAREIATTGALVTEFPTGTGVRREQFPRRNRLISGLAIGVLVAEASVRSGSLLTAQHALEQGREVFAIPGSIHNPLARGCHALIREGAKLVESAPDVFDELPPLTLAADARQPPPPTTQTSAPEALEDDYQDLIEALGDDPVAFDVLARRAGLTADRLSSMLLILELKGYATSCPGGRYVRVR